MRPPSSPRPRFPISRPRRGRGALALLALPSIATIGAIGAIGAIGTIGAIALLWLPAPAAAAVGSWSPIGPDGGTVAAVAVDPANPRVVYAGTSRAGVWKSTDGGLTWAAASQGLLDEHIVALAIDPHRPSTIYAAALTVLFASTDAGGTWSATALNAGGDDTDALASVAVDPLVPGAVYAGTSTRLLVSADGGQRLASAYSFGDGLDVQVAADPVHRRLLALVLAADGFHLYALPLGAAALRDLSHALPAPPGVASGQASVTGWQLAADPASPGALFLAFQVESSGTPPATQAITYRSTDAGASWHLAGPGGFPLAVGPLHTVYAGAVRSADGGASWAPIAAPPDAVETYAAGDTPLSLYAGSANLGVESSADGGQSWQVTSAGLAATAVSALAADAADPALLFAYAGAVGSGRLLVSRNGGGRWRGGPAVAVGAPQGLVNPNLAVDPANPGHVYLGSLNGLAESLDGGATWSPLTPSQGCLSLDSLAIAPAGPALPATLYATGALTAQCTPTASLECVAFKSADGGATWTCLAPALAALAIAPSSLSTLYGMGPAAGAGAATVLYASLDAGATWQVINTAPPLGNLFVHPLDPRRLYVADQTGGLWRSPDGGAHWRSIANGLPPAGEALLFAIDPDAPATLYAAASTIGVFRSANGGGTWQALLSGLPPLDSGVLISEDYSVLLAAPGSSGTLYLATAGQGVLVFTAP
jgi:hypothetical protein